MLRWIREIEEYRKKIETMAQAAGWWVIAVVGFAGLVGWSIGPD